MQKLMHFIVFAIAALSYYQSRFQNSSPFFSLCHAIHNIYNTCSHLDTNNDNCARYCIIARGVYVYSEHLILLQFVFTVQYNVLLIKR